MSLIRPLLAKGVWPAFYGSLDSPGRQILPGLCGFTSRWNLDGRLHRADPVTCMLHLWRPKGQPQMFVIRHVSERGAFESTVQDEKASGSA